MTVRLGSLCTGIRGLDMAVEAYFGAETAWYSEIEKPLLPLLGQWMPGVPNLGDLKVIDWAACEPVDILTAGYPCQPFSHAGLRKGTDDPRHLWPFILEALRHLRPRVVVLENVQGHLSKGFDVVLAGLAEAGFDAEWCLLGASDVGAPHRRRRLWIVAADASRGGDSHQPLGGTATGQPLVPLHRAGDRAGAGRAAAGVHGRRRPAPELALSLLPTPTASMTTGSGTSGRDGGLNLQTAVALLPTPMAGDGEGSRRSADLHWEGGTAYRPSGVKASVSLTDAVSSLLPTPVVNDMGANKTPEQWDAWTADMQARHGNGNGHGASLSIEAQRCTVRWGKYEPAIRRWEALLRPAPAPTVDGKLAPAFVEWMMGYPEGHVGELRRTHALKALGNGAVPQQALAALDVLVPAISEQRYLEAAA